MHQPKRLRLIFALGILWELAVADVARHDMIRPNHWDQNHAAAVGTWGKGNRIGGIYFVYLVVAARLLIGYRAYPYVD
eukprot:scaffold55403_cov44-Attheya_sp.AAC.1